MGNMTEKMRRFCEEYVVDFDTHAAARRAGYQTRGAGAIGSQNLHKPMIQAYIRELMIPVQEAVIEKAAVNATYVTQKLLAIVERSMPEDDGKVDRMGRPITRVKFRPGEAIRALELLGRNIGYFEKDNMQQGGVGVPQVEQLSAEDRATLREALLEVIGSPAVGGEAGPGDGDRITH